MKIDLHKWQKTVKNSSNQYLLEEAWIDRSTRVLGGQFLQGTEEVQTLISFRGDEYRFYCTHCDGAFCSHLVSLVSFYLEDDESFYPMDCPTVLQNNLSNSKWIKSSPKKRRRNLSVLKKKILTMQEGLLLARELLKHLFNTLPRIDSQEELFSLREQVDRLADYHLMGLVEQFRRLISADSELLPHKISSMNSTISEIEQVLSMQLKSEDLSYSNSEAYAYMGHIWKIEELKEFNSGDSGRFLQLAFECRENNYAERLEDTAVWLNLENGEICHSQNLRPFKALRHLKSEDSSDLILYCHEYFKYPGSNNFRIRWQSSSRMLEEGDDYKKALEFARSDWQNIVKETKKILRKPLLLKAPLFLLKFDCFSWDKEDFYLSKGHESLKLKFTENNGWMTLNTLSKNSLTAAAILVEASFDLAKAEIQFSPKCLINPDEKIRLI